jgi:probable rRNA maturation factor
VTAAVSGDGGKPTGDPQEFTDGSATVLASNRQDVRVDEDALAGLATAVLRGEGVKAFELSISFVDTDEMTELHDQYLGEPVPTDVLSFALDDVDGDGIRLLGDVVICPAYAANNNDDLAAELRLLIVHGVLHLLGHDHEDETQRAEMWARQERYSGISVDATGVSREAAG